MRRYKHLRSERTRHGAVVYYFRKGSGGRIRLPDPESPEFEAAFAAAKSGGPIPHVRDMPKTKSEMRKQRTEAALRQRLRTCRNRKAGKLAFDLELDWLLAKAAEQNFSCALTGIEFFAAHNSAGVKDPYAPSLDRIDPKKGYTKDNVRIVIFAINSMLLDWGEDVFVQVANSYRYTKNCAAPYGNQPHRRKTALNSNR